MPIRQGSLNFFLIKFPWPTAYEGDILSFALYFTASATGKLDSIKSHLTTNPVLICYNWGSFRSAVISTDSVSTYIIPPLSKFPNKNLNIYYTTHLSLKLIIQTTLLKNLFNQLIIRTLLASNKPVFMRLKNPSSHSISITFLSNLSKSNTILTV